jgi:hypothetical protein
MQERGIVEALAHNDHCQQAGSLLILRSRSMKTSALVRITFKIVPQSYPRHFGSLGMVAMDMVSIALH